MLIRHSSVVPSPIEEVFAWHQRTGAFTRLSPPWQPIHIRSEADSLKDGTAILQLPGGLRWVAKHDPAFYDPPHRFVDFTGKGGVSATLIASTLHWRHSHNFAQEGDLHTRITDEIQSRVPARMLRPMLHYRHLQLAEDLSAHRRAAEHGAKPMTIAVTGSSGLIGSAICAFLSTGGHTVIRLVRRKAQGPSEREWDPESPSFELLEGVDAVIHLAGESIAGRFTAAHKQAIRQSRIKPTRLLAEVAAQSQQGPKIFISASAIGIYGTNQGDAHLTETSPHGTDFLARVVADWEDATVPAENAGIRTVKIRTGIVQSARGGSLQIYRPLFALGLGGPVAGGNQWVSWIDIDDLVDIYHRALFDDRLSGPVNAVAPRPVRNSDYALTLARVLKRPAFIPVPAFAPRLILGTEGSSNLVENGQYIVPSALSAVNHVFRREELEASLRHQLGRFLKPTSVKR